MKMTSGVKSLLYFTAGLIVGAGGMYIGLKTYFQKRADEEVEDVKAAFGKRLDELEEEKNNALGVANKAIISSGGYESGKNPAGKEAISSGAGILSGIVNNKEKGVDYVNYYKKDFEDSDDSDSDEKVIEEEMEEDISNAVPLDSIEEPTVMPNIEIISPEKFGHRVGYDYKTLYYYVGNDVIVDEDDEVIDDPGYLVGDLLETSGYTSNGEKSIYLRNNKISVDLEICKVFGTYDGPVDI